MSNWFVLIPIVAAICGAVLGALLKPLADQWFERRRRTISVVLDSPYQFKSPFEELKLTWRDHSFECLNNLPFTINNLTGRTIRDVSLKLDAPQKEKEANFSYLALKPESDFRVGDYSSPGSSWELKFEHIARGASVRGFLLSDYAKSLSIYTPDDYEITVTTAGPNRRLALLRGLQMAIAGAGVAATIAAAVTAVLSGA